MTITEPKPVEEQGSSAAAVPDEVTDAVMANVDAGGLELLGPDGVLAELTKRLIERGLSEELSDHLGSEPGAPGGRGSGNNRNGTSPKTVLTDIGAVDLDVPRDRNGTFEPRLVPKHAAAWRGSTPTSCTCTPGVCRPVTFAGSWLACTAWRCRRR